MLAMKSLFYRIFYRPLPGMQWFNHKRHVAISKALSPGATPEDRKKMQQLQQIVRWMMLPMTLIDRVHFWSIKRNVERMNKRLDDAMREYKNRHP